MSAEQMGAIATAVSALVTLGIYLDRRCRTIRLRQEAQERQEQQRQQDAVRAYQEKLRQAAWNECLSEYNVVVQDLDGQLGLEQFGFLLQKHLNHLTGREQFHLAVRNVRDVLRRMVLWTRLRRLYAENRNYIGVHYSEVQLEEFINTRMGHDQSPRDVQTAFESQSRYFHDVRKRWKPPEPRPIPPSYQEVLAREWYDAQMRTAYASARTPSELEARKDQIEQEYRQRVERARRAG